MVVLRARRRPTSRRRRDDDHQSRRRRQSQRRLDGRGGTGLSRLMAHHPELGETQQQPIVVIGEGVP